MNIEQRQSLLDSQVSDFNTGDEPMELDDAFMRPPIGTEGADHNHAGGDKELLTEMANKVAQGTSSYDTLPTNKC
jgi:hypothetical protein